MGLTIVIITKSLPFVIGYLRYSIYYDLPSHHSLSVITKLSHYICCRVAALCNLIFWLLSFLCLWRLFTLFTYTRSLPVPHRFCLIWRCLCGRVGHVRLFFDCYYDWIEIELLFYWVGITSLVAITMSIVVVRGSSNTHPFTAYHSFIECGSVGPG